MPLARATDYAKQAIAEVLTEGDRAIDATVGNGRDTLFLAQRVGASGHVYGFDPQARALAAARARLHQAALHERVTLFQAGHEQLAAHVGAARRLRAAMFNLGYLPQGDKSFTTRPATTLPALDAALALLAPGGRLTVVLYAGHAGGEEESEAVLAWAGALAHECAQVLRYQFLNPRTPPPSLLVIERR